MEVFKHWTDDNETTDTARPPKWRNTSRGPDKMSIGKVNNEQGLHSKALNMVPKASTGDLPHVQKANSSATVANELLNKIAKDFKSDEKNAPKVTRRWTSKIWET